MAINFNEQSFNSDVLNGKGLVVVDFWASWCGPCKMLAPIIDDIAKDYDGKILIGKVNVDEEPSIAEKYEVMSIPTVILFKDGKPVEKSIGLVPKAKLTKMIDENL